MERPPPLNNLFSFIFPIVILIPRNLSFLGYIHIYFKKQQYFFFFYFKKLTIIKCKYPSPNVLGSRSSSLSGCIRLSFYQGVLIICFYGKLDPYNLFLSLLYRILIKYNGLSLENMERIQRIRNLYQAQEKDFRYFCRPHGGGKKIVTDTYQHLIWFFIRYLILLFSNFMLTVILYRRYNRIYGYLLYEYA